jgi:hypothetical protein
MPSNWDDFQDLYTPFLREMDLLCNALVELEWAEIRLARVMEEQTIESICIIERSKRMQQMFS